ncbi:MAG: SIS domain-containing protein, partial [Chloroflexota bacterium]|nr:SIS domain-containing protein [Chloroflexota bacterium]
VLPEAQEESVVQTRAFSSLLLATIATASAWGNRDDLLEQLERVPDVSRELMDQHLSLATEIATNSDFDSCYFLGSGPQYGLACEASLKMKEMALTPSEPFHFLELRHGPKSIINPSMLVVGLHSRKHLSIERDVMEEAKSLGGRTLTLGASHADMNFPSALDEAATSLLYLPSLQWLAAERASQRGIDPDRPKNLDTVVRLERLS